VKGMRVNLPKTKLMIGGKRHSTTTTVGQLPCAVVAEVWA